jgi:DNA-binding CsgD family transcriptional regulator
MRSQSVRGLRPSPHHRGKGPRTVRMGRLPKLSPTRRAHAMEMRRAGKSLQEIDDVLGVSHMTV